MRTVDLHLRCEDPVRPGTSGRLVVVTEVECRPRRLVLIDLAGDLVVDPAEWVVDDVLVAGQSQLAGARIPGQCFAPGVGFDLLFDELAAGAVLEVDVRYVGSDIAGRRIAAVFVADL